MLRLQPNTTLQGGKYRIERVLGQGGFGITYLATHANLGRQVAIKEFFIKGVNERDEGRTTISVSNSDNRALFEEQLEKFCKEARRLNSLNNEHIVKVHDLFGENGTWYYVMEMIDGESLSERLNRTKRPLSEKEMDSVLPQILDALKEIHQNGMWHLDIKPSNIMIDKNNVVKLIDFGASKQIDPETGGPTIGTQFAFTPGYAPIELEGNDKNMIGNSTDFYSLGATIYKLLTSNDPPKPSVIINYSEDAFDLKHISSRYKELIVWMMQPKIEKRPQSVNDIDLVVSSPVQEPKPAPADKDEETIVAKQPEKPQTSKQEPLPFPTKMPKVIPNNTNDGGPDKKNHGIWLLLILGVLVGFVVLISKHGVSNNNSEVIIPQKERKFEYKQYNINGVVFDMVLIQDSLNNYYIGKTEVTNELWNSAMNSIPSDRTDYIASEDNSFFQSPVTGMTWGDANKFIEKINEMTGENFRLPTEKEWEYAASGANQSKEYCYAGSNNPLEVAWFHSKIHPVALLEPNEIGIYDMSGNVWEWCDGSEKNDNCTLHPYRGGGAYDDKLYSNIRNKKNRLIACDWWSYFEVGFRLAKDGQ